MKLRIRTAALLAAMGFAAALRAGTVDLDRAFDQLKAHEHGGALTPLVAIEAAIDASSNDAAQRARLVDRLSALLKDPATAAAARQFICRQLERVGGDGQVPVLAAMLADPRAGEFARRALQEIPGQAAGAALRAALPQAKGAMHIGIIHALGERRDAPAVKPLAALLAAKEAAVAVAAARALGKIATPEAAEALAKAAGTPEVQQAAQSARLACAARLPAERAKAIYQDAMGQDRAPHVRAAGLVGLVRVGGDEAAAPVAAALAGKDPALRTAAVRLVPRLSEAGAAALAKRLPSLAPAAQALVVESLAERGGDAARAAAKALAQSPDPAVRQAALRALGRLGDTASVAALLARAASGEGDEQKAARQALARLPGKEVGKALAEAAMHEDWRVRLEAVEAIALRRDPGAAATLLKAAGDGHDRVRLAALAGLADVADASHYPALARLLAEAPTHADIQAARKAVLAVARKVEDEKQRIAPLLAVAKAPRPEVRAAALAVFGRLGGTQALATLRASVKDADPRVADAAVRALAGWPDRAAAADLLALVEKSPSETHRTLALRGFLRMASAAKGKDEATKMLAQVGKAAKSPNDKKMLLAVATQLNSPGALAVAASLVGDEQVNAEATLAVLQIARALRAEHPDAIQAPLARIVKLARDPDAVRQANVLLGKTAFTPLFDGKSLAGWTKPFDWGDVAIEDGAIHLKGDKKFFLVTKKTYGDFVLELEANIDEGANSGIQVRSHFKKNRVWGYQADVDSLPRGWRGLYDEETGRAWLDRGDAKKAEEVYRKGWNAYRVECIGTRIRFFLNDALIVDHIDPAEIDGHIALQHHGEKGKTCRFRNVRLMDLGTRRWLPLLDEASLPRWHSNGIGKWTVENGAIVGRKTVSGYGLLFSDRVYRDFAIRFEVKAVRGNAGFYIRAEDLKGPQGARGIQVEIDPAKNPSGLYETHGRQWVGKPDPKVVAKHFRRGDWNAVAVTARGGRLVVHLNNHQTVNLPKDTGRPEGLFGLGLHSGNVHTEFRNIQILSD